MNNNQTVNMAHGSGGRMSRDFVKNEILSAFKSPVLQGLPDAAPLPGGLLMTTDGHVVSPVEFPGGDIGKLAVCGSCNDIAVSGGEPLWMSLAVVMEEGLPLGMLRKILASAARTAELCGVQIVTGDTKVVSRGQCDKIFITTACVGRLLPGFAISANNISPGDSVIVSGPVGDHGLAVMAARQGFANGPSSDCGPVSGLVRALSPSAGKIRFMRDPTRGGLAAVLNEAVEGRPFGIELDEASVPVSPAAKTLSETLGIDPLHAACEGRVLLVCDSSAAGDVLEAWRKDPSGAGAALIGTVSDAAPGRVTARTVAGGRRIIDLPMGEILPRIC